MGWLGAIGFCFAFLTLTQISYKAEGCKILTAAPSGPSSILVKWKHYIGATSYFLELRAKNITNIVPVVVTLPATQTEKIVRGLLPGTNYSVTLKVFQLYIVVCVDSSEASTVPDTSQIIDGEALSSTSIMVKWTEVPSAEQYLLQIRSEDNSQIFNVTITEHSTVVGNLTPFTNYDCIIYTVNHGGMGSKSNVRTVTTLMQPPLGVTVTQTGHNTARVMWLPVEDVLLYHVEVQNIDEPNNGSTAYNVSDTNVDLDTILPCSTYRISVSSFSWFLMPSEPMVYTYTTNKLSPVSSVSVDYSCATQSVMVHWTAVLEANFYKTTAMDQNGILLTCSSQGTSCHISGLSCGQTFMVHVTPMSENCKNMINATSATFQTVPCPPKNLELFRDCSSEVVIFSWEHTNKTDHYMARAVDSKGVVHECLTMDNSCYFTNTMCGRQYYFTVYSISGQCKSQTSSTVDIRTAPCIPQNLQTSAGCHSNVLVSKWDPAEGALRYTVEAFGNRGHGHYNCSTLSNSCAIENIPCGEHLTIFITAFDDECASPRRLAPVAETVPCTPHNVTAVKECGADSITVTWAVSGSTLFYVAMAMDSSGTVHRCNAMDLICTIAGLKCSTIYTTYVIGSNFKCNSTQSEAVTIETASCPPDNVTASLNCEANEALISWHGRPGFNSYTVTIVDKYDRLLSCTSNETTCRVPNLKCGQLYTITVCHHDSFCSSIPSQPIYIESVPCPPSTFRVDIECEENAAILTWTSAEGAAKYYGCAQTVEGESLYCVSANNSCTIKGLQCGSMYNFSVEASDGFCNSSLSASVEKGPVPCAPTAVDVRMQKIARNHWLMTKWERVNCSYVEYLVEISGQIQDNHQALMSLSSYWLSVPYFETLMPCGTLYNLTVRSRNSAGTSEPSSAFSGVTVPCAPMNVRYSSISQSAVISWETSVLATAYSVYDVSGEGSVELCTTAGLSCQLTNFSPGTIAVIASNAVGESLPSGNITGPGGTRRKRDMRSSLIHSNIDKALEIPNIGNLILSGVSIHVNWTPVNDATEYILIVVEEAREQHYQPRVRIVESYFHTETDLKPRTTYCIMVAARTPISQSNYSRPKCKTTAASK